MSAFRILVADDHPVFRFGVCSLLGSHEDLEICGQVADGRPMAIHVKDRGYNENEGEQEYRSDSLND